jgi:PAS domain S-box-containing protein
MGSSVGVRRRITLQLAATLALLSALAIAGFVVMTVAVRNLQSVDRARSTSTNALITAGQLERSVLDLETGLRGYLLAGEARFLQPYTDAVSSYRALVAKLELDTAGEPRQHALATSIGSSIDNYVNLWAEPQILRARSQLNAARAQEAGGIGKQRVDAIRSQFATFIANENATHADQVQRGNHLADVAIVVGFVAIGLFVVLMAVFAFRGRRGVYIPLRRLASTTRKISRGDRSARVPVEGTAEIRELLEGFNRMASSLEDQQEELERTAQSLDGVLETIDQGIYRIDLDGNVTLVNRAALDQTGFTREELMGANSHALLHHTRPDGTPYPVNECPVAEAMRTGEGVRITNEVFWRKNGSQFPVEYSAFPLMERGNVAGAVVSFRDVSARRHLQRLRDGQHALSRALAEASSLEGVRPQMMGSVASALGFDFGVTWEPAEDGKLRRVATFASSGFEDMAERLGPDELPLEGTLAARAIARRDPVFERDFAHHPPRAEGLPDPRLKMGAATPVFGSDGQLVSVGEMFGTHLIPEEGVVDTLRAISAHAAQYIERQRAVAESQRLKDQFVATVSHELRTPLTAIDGWVHILLGEEPGPLTDDQRKFLHTVKRNSGRLMGLVGDLLLANQIDTGRFNLELADIDVAELAHETGELLLASAENKQIDFSIDAVPPILIRGDRQRLGQLFGNLMSNAIKYTPNEGRVEVKVEREGETCRITVADTGIGIPAADRGRLFERFYRASSATDHGIGGTGLGLAISKAIVEGHNGTIKLADHDGPGSVFVVELPIAVREGAPT